MFAVSETLIMVIVFSELTLNDNHNRDLMAEKYVDCLVIFTEESPSSYQYSIVTA